MTKAAPSRRSFLAMALGVPLLRAKEYIPLSIDRLREPSAGWSTVRRRAYRADAVVTLLGVPIFSKRAAGSAIGSIRECARGDQKILALAFAGGSDPKRTHGINYSGAAEEIAVEHRSELAEAASFGFVTASQNDESFEQAKRRVIQGEQCTSFVAVDALHRSARVRTRKTYLSLESSTGLRQLARNVRSRFAESSPPENEIAIAATGVPATFLYTMLSAARSPESRKDFSYVHNAKCYTLECDKSIDSHNLMRLNGRIHDRETKRTSNFRLWFEPESELPVRIEFSPRSYLRITLEFDATLEDDAKEDL